jgi:hypothetical protein
MVPKFADELAWQQAEFLMQPIYIRIIDRIRQRSEASTWQVSYEEVQIPHLTHYLCLQSGDRKFQFDIWDLCYQVCFVNYLGSYSGLESKLVEVDTSLIDMAAGMVNWERLDHQADSVIARIFENLPD